jgi:hypothetical protein
VGGPAATYGQQPNDQVAYPQDPYPQGPYPQAAYPQAAYPQAAYPQAAYPQAAYPQAAYPQGPYPQGPYPQAAYPQGPYPQGPDPRLGVPYGQPAYFVPTRAAAPVLSIVAFVLSAIALIFVPILFGGAAIVCASIGVAHRERPAKAALAVAITATIVGIALGVIVGLRTLAH